ncbi:MAG: flippase [Campylobacterales bacterium]|nr:flippase [Campylobacterales bacterium]
MIAKIRQKLNRDLHFKEILTGSAVTFVLKMSGMLLGYIVVLMVSRMYGAEGVGFYSLSVSVLTFLAMVSALGMNVSILRYVGQFNKADEAHKLKLLYRYALQLSLPVSLVMSALLFWFAEAIATYVFDNATYTQALRFVALMVPFFTLQEISVEFIRGLKKLKVSEYLRSVNRPLFNIVLLGACAYVAFSDIMAPLYTLGVGIVAGGVIAYMYIRKHLRHIADSPSEGFNKRELLNTSAPMMVTTLASYLMGNISLVLLEVYATTEEVGIFSVAFKIASLISLTLMVVNTISAPKFAELYWGQKHKELQQILDQSSKLIFFSAATLSFLILVFNKHILALFGAQFVEGSMVLGLLIIGEIINAASGSVGVFLNMSGHQSVLRNIFCIALFVSALIQIVFIPMYGIMAAATAAMIGMIIVNLIPAIYILRKLNFRTYYSPFKWRTK